MLYKLINTVINKIEVSDIKLISLSHKHKRMLILIVAAFFFGIILKLNMMTSLWLDDYSYTFIYETDEKVKNVSDIIYSQYLHYIYWGGRSVAHFIAQLLLLIEPFYADVLNTLIYTIFTFIIYFHIKGNKKEHNISVFVLVNLFLWFFQPAYAETILWITGSANYLWCTLLILLFLLPYRLYTNAEVSPPKAILYSIGMFIYGIIAGWTNENVALAMIVMAILWICLFGKQRWRIPVWSIFGLIGAIIGFLMLVCASGNYARFEVAEIPDRNYNLFFVYFKFNMFTGRLAENIGSILTGASVLFFLVLKFSKTDKVYFISTVIIYLLGVLIPVYIMIPSPTFPDRAWFGLTTFSIILFGVIFYQMNYHLDFIRNIRSSILILVFTAFIFNFYRSYKEIKLTENLKIERENIIQNAIQRGNDVVKVDIINNVSKYGMGEGSWVLPYMSKYYGIKLVDYTDESVSPYPINSSYSQ